MSNLDPFIEEMRTNLNDFNTKSEQRVKKARKARRKRIVGRIALSTFAMAVSLGVGTAIVNAQQADATSQSVINQFIRANHGIAPCKHEDGSDQPGPCVWLANVQGNGDGWSYVAMPNPKFRSGDKVIVYLTGPKAVRY